MESQKKRGLFIVFEGLDRVGKSSQVNLLKDSLSSYLNTTVHLQRFPDRTTHTGKELNELLNNNKKIGAKATHLLFSFNRWEKMEDLKDKIMNQGACVIVDRYAFSGVVYSIANGVDKDYCLYPDKGLLRPDVVIQLDMNLEVLNKREGYGNEIYEKDEFQAKVKQNYNYFSDKIYWKKLDADKPKDELHNEIMLLIKDLIDKFESGNSETCSQQLNGYPQTIYEDLFMSEDV